MTTSNTIQSLFQLTLRVGLPVVRENQTIFYKQVKLREIDLADERWAVRAAERLVMWQGTPKLVVSDEDHKLALTLRHIENFNLPELGAAGVISTDLIDFELAGKLKPFDIALIQERVFLIELALKVRYGEIPQSQFDAYVAGTMGGNSFPQPVGPAAAAGEPGPAAGSGPVMLADLSGPGAAGQGHGPSAGAGAAGQEAA